MVPLITLLVTYFIFAVIMKQALSGAYSYNHTRLLALANRDPNVSIDSEQYSDLQQLGCDE